MALNDILDRKVNRFFNDKWSVIEISKGLLEYQGESVDSLLYKLEELVKEVIDPSSKEYIYLRILSKVDLIQYSEDLMSKYDDLFFISDIDNAGVVFKSNKEHLTDEIKLKIVNMGFNVKAEMYTREEFEDLLSRIDKIAISIFEFQQKSYMASEIIYDSIDEIKEELKSQVEKGKIFGKEFVEQQLSGYIMDMAFKGSFFAMLSHAPEQISEIADHVKGLL